MVLAPIQFSGASLGSRIGAGIQQGQQIAQGQNILEQQRLGIQQQRQQQEQAQAQQAQLVEQQALSKSLLERSRTGTPIETVPEFAQLLVDNPTLADTTRQAAGITTEFQKNDLADFGLQLNQLAGNAPAQQQLIEQRVLELQRQGRNFRDTGMLLEASPEKRQQFATLAMLQAFNTDELKEIAGKAPPSLQALTPAAGGGFVGVDPRTQQSVFVPPPAGKRTEKQVETERKSQEERVKTELKESETDFDRAQKLRAEISKASTEFNKLNSAFGRIEASSADPSAAGDLALIFNFMKMLDPGSVVREGEFATAQNAAGVDTKIINQYNRLLTGERLAPKQRTDFLNQSRNIFERAQEDNVKAVEKIVDIGKQFGVSRGQLLGRRLEDLTPEEVANLSDEELQTFSAGGQ